MTPFVWFLVMSGAIAVVIEIFKKLKWTRSSKIFNDVLPLIGPILGVVAGLLVGPSIAPEQTLGAYSVLGLLAGGMSNASYSIIKAAAAKKAESYTGEG